MSEPTTLLDTLGNSDMLEIDGLHAWQFDLVDGALRIECIDGRDRRVWQFSAEQVQQARAEADGSWRIDSDQGEHHLVCMEAFSGSNDDDEEDEDEAPEHA